MAEFSQPIFYRYYEHQILKSVDFGFHEDVTLLVFGPNISDLADPNIEPVGVYHYAGIRRYLWRNSFWSETDWDRRRVKERTMELLRIRSSIKESMAHRRILELINVATTCGAPSPTDTQPPLDDTLTRAVKIFLNISINDFVVEANKKKKYCRAIYKINV